MTKQRENTYKRKNEHWYGRYKNGLKSNKKMRYLSVYVKSYTEVKASLIVKRTEKKNQFLKFHFGAWQIL